MARQADGGRPGRSPASPTLLAAFLISKASPRVQHPDFGLDIAKIKISDSVDRLYCMHQCCLRHE